MQKEVGKIVKSVDVVSRKWKEKVERLRGRVEGLQRELVSGREGTVEQRKETIEQNEGEDKA